MKIIQDKTGQLTLIVDEKVAEPSALLNAQGKNLLWCGDTQYWSRHDPILFPTIGRSFDERIIVDGRPYPMPKHGFANKGPWTVVEHGTTPEGEGRLVLEFRDSANTRLHYPFAFCVRQTFETEGPQVLRVSWEVSSPEDLPFMMGAHPAFALPHFNPEDEVHGYLQLDTPDIVSQRVLPDGYLHDDATVVALQDGNLLPLGNETFACDTLLDIRGLNRHVTLLDKEQHPIVTLHHSMPVIAFWAPNNGRCPFVCIEPWCGGCDAPGSTAEFSQRPFVQKVQAGKPWSTSYTIEIKD